MPREVEKSIQAKYCNKSGEVDCVFIPLNLGKDDINPIHVLHVKLV